MRLNNIDYSNESLLVVDDDDDIKKILEALLESLGFSVGTTSRGPDALKMLKEGVFTFMLTDMKMPEMDGLELVQRVGDSFPNVSIIAMTGYSEGYRYVDVINAGASDFIKKPFDLGELEAKVRRIINERDLRDELNRLSITDSLTGLYNQRHFYIRLKEEVVRAQRQKRPLALILLDLDNFKHYNDNRGHLAGDEALRQVGGIINKSIREGVDAGFRYGGDEFAIILIDSDLFIAKEIGRRVEESLKESVQITASLGYTKFSDDMSPKDFVSEADKSLYSAKQRKNGLTNKFR